jgi:hypothetical protein
MTQRYWNQPGLPWTERFDYDQSPQPAVSLFHGRFRLNPPPSHYEN